MSEETVGQRLKFLIETLGMKTGAFSRVLGVSETNVRNYTERNSKPGADFLEKLIMHFEQINLTWLLTGRGEPLILPANENNQTTAHAEKFFRSPVVGTNHGTAYQENNATPAAADVEALKNKLALAEKEVEHLKVQLAMKDALLTSKEETLALLRISFNRPN